MFGKVDDVHFEKIKLITSQHDSLNSPKPQQNHQKNWKQGRKKLKNHFPNGLWVDRFFFCRHGGEKGEPLFGTDENLEHLALMEPRLNGLPKFLDERGFSIAIAQWGFWFYWFLWFHCFFKWFCGCFLIHFVVCLVIYGIRSDWVVL